MVMSTPRARQKRGAQRLTEGETERLKRLARDSNLTVEQVMNRTGLRKASLMGVFNR